MSNQVTLALNQIIRKIELLTRFDRESLDHEAKPGRVATGSASWRFSPRISNIKVEHTGPLPYGATGLDSADKLDADAQQTQNSAHAELPQRIQAWLKTNERTDRELQPSDCFNGPKVFGYEYRCPTCLGERSVKCPNCTYGYNDCSRCKGKGHFDCSNCESFWGNVKGKVKCRPCDGTGKKDGQRCQSCNGKGKIECPKCHGRKIIECNPCGGRGKIPCSTCHTTGKVPCTTCDAMGHLHFLRTIECTVSANWRVELPDNNAEVVQELVKRNLDKLRSIASVTQLPATVESNTVTRNYNVECVVTELIVTVAGTRVGIIGYGDKAQIFDFKNIVPIILTEDLAALEQAVADTRLRLWGNPTKLLTATKQFLESEVNIDIDNPTYITEQIIDSNYVEKVKLSVPVSLKRLFAANIGLALLVTTIVPTLLFLISHFTGLREMIGNWVFVAPLVAAVTSWILLERRTRNRLTLMFEDSEQKKVDGLLKKYYILWKFRALVLLLTVALLVIAAAVPLPVPLP